MIRLFITDVDGTLTDEFQRVVPKALEALWRLKSKGVKVGLASALPYCSLRYLTTYFGLDNIVIAEGGGVLEVEGTLKILGSRDLSIKALETLKKLFKGGIVEKWSNKCRLVDISIERSIDLRLVSEAVKNLGVKVVDTKYAYHLIGEEVSKGVALKELLNMLRIDKSEVAVAGDSMGDYELFLEAGVRIAPSNASRELKEIANYVSPHFGGYGLADGVDWILKNYF